MNSPLDKTVEYRILDVMNVIRQLNKIRTEDNKQQINNVLGILTRKVQNGVKFD